MTNPASVQKRNGKYLWFALLGLGFQPDCAISSIGKTNINVKHINLGPNMFDKPNKDAFYIVTHFLLDKLNPTRFSETYRFCWPVLNHKADAEFRKVTCAWLREMMDDGSTGSKVVASLFLSPGGPKFTSLMLSLANHVMLQEMKTFHTEDSWVPEAAAMPASSLNVAAKRLDLIHRRFLRTAVEQDRLLHEYQRRAQLLVKSAKDLRAEGSEYDELLKRHGGASSGGGDSWAEKIRKVRSLWAAVDEMMSSIKAEREVVESVLQGEVDQHVLDGTGRALKVPRSLQERVEQLPQQLSSGRVYDSGQLNLLCLLELTNHSLQLLKEEHSRLSGAPKPDLSPAPLREKCGQMSRALQSLQLIRQKISKDGIPAARSCIRELEADWDRKWSETLKAAPLAAFLREDRVVGFLSPMAPLSFEPVAEARCGIFSQFPATVLGEAPAEVKPQEVEPTRSDLSSPEAAVPAETTPSQANTSLDWLFDASPPPRTPVAQGNVQKTTKDLRSAILERECENLANQFADAVATPSEGRFKGLDLESLLNTLHADPFSTRKQLPRTPESLNVKSSWRKAVEEDKAEKLGRAGTVGEDVTGGVESRVVLDCTLNGGVPAEQQGAPSHTPLPLWDTSAQFALDQETLPELQDFDSLLSLDEDDLKSEDGSFLKRSGTPHRDWRGDLAETTEKVFSLDLDNLEAPPTPKTQEYVLPNLITFSPIDDI